MTCPFCPESQTLANEIVHKDDHCFVVKSIDPVLPDAVLIIPVRHVATPFELDEAEWRSTHRLLRWAKAYLEQEKPDGFSIGWNVHEVGGQSIPHAHLHVIARFADEPLAGTGIRHALKQESNRRQSAR